MTKIIDIENYQLNIYGDGLYEYEGFHRVLITKYDECGDPIDDGTQLYIKCDDVSLFDKLTVAQIEKLYRSTENSTIKLKIAVKIKRIDWEG